MKDTIINKIEEKLKTNLEGTNLNSLQWDERVQCTMGPTSEGISDFALEAVKENHLADELIEFYHEWCMENTEPGQMPDEADWDGWVFIGFQFLLAKYFEEIQDELVYDEFYGYESKLKEMGFAAYFSDKVDRFGNPLNDNSFLKHYMKVFGEYYKETDNNKIGFQVYIFGSGKINEVLDELEIVLTKYTDWDSTGYLDEDSSIDEEFDTFEEMVDYIKNSLNKEVEAVA